MKKNKIKFSTILIMTLVAIILGSNLNVSAIAQSIQIGNVETIPTYIGNSRVPMKKLTDGTPIYCMDVNKTTPRNTTAYLKGEYDSGVAYLLANGYPNKRYTNDDKKDYYITQAAIWWYLDNTTGSSNLSYGFKHNSSDPNNLRPTIKKLVDGAEQARKNGYSKPSISLESKDYSMKLEGDYYVSNDIYLQNKNNINEYKVTVSGLDGIEIIDLNGTIKDTFSANEKFRVRVKSSALNSLTAQINVKVSAVGGVYKAYKYQSENEKYQPVVISKLQKENVEVSANITIKIDLSKVKIVKIDSTTGKALPGASLELKDENGKVVTSWVSTNNYHVIRNLKNGTYTVEETKAPEGYLLTQKKYKFTISNETREVEVKVENKPRISVVNILKIDKSTGKTLSGAKLRVLKANGEQVAEFVSGTKPYVLTDLPNGKYLVEEVEAPKGYVLSNEKIFFTISDDKLSYQIEFGNTPQIIVPDTSSSSIILTIIGIILTTIGFGYIYKNVKEN